MTDGVRDKLRDKLLRKQKDEGRKAITDADRRRWELPEKGKAGSTGRYRSTPILTGPRRWPMPLPNTERLGEPKWMR